MEIYVSNRLIWAKNIWAICISVLTHTQIAGWMNRWCDLREFFLSFVIDVQILANVSFHFDEGQKFFFKKCLCVWSYIYTKRAIYYYLSRNFQMLSNSLIEFCLLSHFSSLFSVSQKWQMALTTVHKMKYISEKWQYLVMARRSMANSMIVFQRK